MAGARHGERVRFPVENPQEKRDEPACCHDAGQHAVQSFDGRLRLRFKRQYGPK